MLYPLDWCVSKIKELESRVTSVTLTVAGSTYVPLYGATDPEGLVTGLFIGQTYLNTSTNALWAFNGTVGTSVGWV